MLYYELHSFPMQTPYNFKYIAFNDDDHHHQSRCRRVLVLGTEPCAHIVSAFRCIFGYYYHIFFDSIYACSSPKPLCFVSFAPSFHLPCPLYLIEAKEEDSKRRQRRVTAVCTGIAPAFDGSLRGSIRFQFIQFISSLFLAQNQWIKRRSYENSTIHVHWSGRRERKEMSEGTYCCMYIGNESYSATAEKYSCL